MQIHIRKDRFKFSSAHMTVFADGTKERLHGHNYQVELTAELRSPTEIVPFSGLKAPLDKLCSQWDEKVLLAKGNRHLKNLSSRDGSTSFSLCGKNYSLPSDEIELLDTENITSESLASLFIAQYLSSLSVDHKKSLRSVTIRIEETPGQGASETCVLN